jgi:uncharacterized 2Fe-2S/4Fe-4S cluster protein (DUF4445 family)
VPLCLWNWVVKFNMPLVTFQPTGITVDVTPGTELLDAARQAGVEIDLPCGGKGTCGKCAVRIAAGDVECGVLEVQPETGVEEGFVLACKARVANSDVTVDVPPQAVRIGGKFIEDSDDLTMIRGELLPSAHEYDPLAIKLAIDVVPPRKADGFSDLDRITNSLKSRVGEKKVSYALPVIRQAADALRANNGKVTLTLVGERDFFHVTRIEPGDNAEYNYGIVVDVGTTTVTVQLVFIPQAKIVRTLSDYNGQIACGLDVISRINYVRRPDRLEYLRACVLATINDLVRLAADDNGIDPADISSGVISGNTTMIHLLLGLNPEHIRLDPYTPTVFEVPFLTAVETGVCINPQSLIVISPSIGSYVGGDITAGILCTDLVTDSEEINLFVDIGTNGEIVVGNKDFLIACACSAGPAFEGGGIKCGMRAASGAVERIEVDPGTGSAQYQTVGNARPQGICGSGMISLLANLFLTGWIDAAGKLNRSRASYAISVDGRHARYTIVSEEDSATGSPITVDEQEIENIIRAKAAIYSACSLILEQVGIGFDDIANIYLAGGFGSFLDVDNAVVIGLLPDLPREKFRYVGNSSLKGGYMVLVSQKHRQRQLEHARRMTYVELSTDPGYMDQYTGALFLPHTDLRRFPSEKTTGGNGH